MMTYIKKGNVVIRFHQQGELREASILTNHGCTFDEEYKRFVSKYEGNNEYKSYIADGFVKATEDDYYRVVRGY